MVSADVDSGTDGGSVCNEAQLDGAACGGTLNVIIGYDEFNNPIYATYECAPAADADASDCAQVGPPSACSFNDGDYCTYAHGAYAGPGAPGTLYNNNFLTVFTSGLTIGVVGADPLHDAKWNATTTGRANLKTALGGGGAPGPLTADTVDATSISGGTLSRATAALTLNIRFNAAGINGTHTNLGSLTLCNLAGGSVIGSWTLTAAQAAGLNGKTISQVLADANNALGGNGLPSYVGSFGDLNQLVGTLNDSFASCTVSAFATNHLCPICSTLVWTTPIRFPSLWGHLSAMGLAPNAAIITNLIADGFPSQFVSFADSNGNFELDPSFPCLLNYIGVYSTSTTAANQPITSNTVNSPCD
jgi:hypothetical protein